MDEAISFYNACCAVLAEKLEIPLVTADETLAKAVKSAVFVGDLEISPFEEV